jgi:NAD(P)-dependent dehydrogenase (short-subunit alcohol dehydrogenase family)
VASEAARPSAPRTLSLWHWPEITPSIGCTWATGVLLQAARASRRRRWRWHVSWKAFLVWLRAGCDGARGGGMNAVHIVDTARSLPPTAWVETLQERRMPPRYCGACRPLAGNPIPPEETCMATTRKPRPPQSLAQGAQRQHRDQTAADPDRPRVVKTATRKAAASDPRAARVAARQRRLQDQEKAKDARAAKKATKKTATQAGARRQPEAMPAQQLAKPGHEHELELAPRFLAPDYTGSGKLQGMRAIVTGGDSGIGRAVAVLFAREGADVAVLHLDEAEDADITRQHVEREGGRCVVIAGDVRDPRFCNKAVKQVAKAFGGIDILVNNAAFQLHCERLEDLEDAHLQETLQTNIGGYIQMARAVLPHLGEGASIINTGSETGIFGSKALIDYSATKGAIHAFTKALASQLLPRGIRVNCVAPGPVWTPLNPADKQAEDVAEFGKDSDMGRPAQPEELSPAYVFLASPVCASYISGVILPVMGGPRG